MRMRNSQKLACLFLLTTEIAMGVASAQTAVPLFKFDRRHTFDCQTVVVDQPPPKTVCVGATGNQITGTGQHCDVIDQPAVTKFLCGWDSALSNPSNLPDGDWINVFSDGCVDGSSVGVSLEVADDLTWWKGLRANGQSLELSGRGQSFPSTPWLRVGPITISVRDLPGKTLILSKAKELGIHRDVYQVDLNELAPYFGRNVVFQWRSDGGLAGNEPNPAFATTAGSPLDGTLLREANGAIWVVVAGGAFHVPDPATLNRLFPGKPMLPVNDGWPESELQKSTDGTLLREEDGTISVIAGGAKFHVPDQQTLSRLFPMGTPFQLWTGALSSAPNSPIDGTLLKDDDGTTWVIEGRAKFAIPDVAGLSCLFPARPPVMLWNGALSQLPDIPTDGTLIRETNGTTWVIYGNAKLHIPDPQTYSRFFGPPPVQMWNGVVNNIPDIPVDGTVFRDEDNWFWVIAGHAKFRVPDSTTHDLLYPAAPIVHIWNGALDQLTETPADNSLLQERNLLTGQDGITSVIVGRAKFNVPDKDTLLRFFGTRTAFPLWNGALSRIPKIPIDGTILREESSSQVYIIVNGHKVRASPLVGPAHVLWDGALSQIPLGVSQILQPVKPRPKPIPKSHPN